MLSTKSITNASRAEHYFLGQDNYYTQDKEAKEHSQWWGKGAIALGLSNEVDANVFTTLLKGQLPHGQQLGIKQEGRIKHRPGFDLTFSAPKSVSLLALLGNDQRMSGAVQSAVDKTLEHIERDCAQARITHSSITTYQSTQNLVVAKFLHDVSREGDPQLHVHCVVMNMTQRQDGQWRSLASQGGDYGSQANREINGFLEQVRHHKHHYGLLFRAELAHALRQMGYEIVKTGKNGLFEVKGITEKTLHAYSERRHQIEAYMREQGFSGAKAAAVATLQTRRAKSIHRETLYAQWQARSHYHQVDAFNEAKETVARSLSEKQNSPAISPIDFTAAKEAVQAAIQHLSETEVAISEIQLLNTALHHAIGENVNVAALLQAIHESEVNGQLIPLHSYHPSNGPCFTTKELIHYEREILQASSVIHLSAKSLLPDAKINAYLATQQILTAEQKKALHTLFSSDHQMMALEGKSGSGKTMLLKQLVALSKRGGYHAVVLTYDKASQMQIKGQHQPPPSSIVDWLKQHLNHHRYETVSQFLAGQKKWLDAGRNVLRKHIVFVDQATLLSSKQMYDLVTVSQKTGARLVLLGDAKSVLPWQSGAPYLQLLQHGILCARLRQSHRLQQQALSSSTQAISKGDIAAAFDHLKDQVVAIENKEARLEQMATHFTSLSLNQQHQARVVMPTQHQCEAMNALIRDQLKQQGVLAATGLQITALLPKNLSESQRRIAKSYQAGQWLRFNALSKSLGVKPGDYCKIKTIQPMRNLIFFENVQGKIVQWNPATLLSRAGTYEVFEPKLREIAVGDRLLWQRNNVSKTLHKGERLQVTGLHNQHLKLTRANGKSLKINLKELSACHFDYSYAITPSQLQSDTAIVIAYQNCFSRQSHQRLFYKIISQTTKQAWIYTEDRTKLLNNLMRQKGDKPTALAAWGEKELSTSQTTEEKGLNSALDKTPIHVAQEAIHYAVAHLSEQETAFSHKAMLQVALEFTLGKTDLGSLEQAMSAAEKNGLLIRGVSTQQEIYWTTPEAVETERAILTLATQHQGKLTAMASLAVIAAHLHATQPKTEHALAIREIMQATDPVILMQGYAGTGKTTLLKHVSALLKQQEFELLCLAPTHTAVKELKERGLHAQTLDSYLVQCQSFPTDLAHPHYHYRHIIAVDESSMLSNRQLRAFLEITQLTQTRVLILGDQEQYPAIEAGKPFSLLQQSGLKVIKLTDIERQKEATLKQAVSEAYRGKFATAFDTLANNIIEIGEEKVGAQRLDNRHKRLRAIVQDYFARTPLEREQTLIITLGNQERVLLNNLIREQLQLRGELQGKNHITTILVSRNMTYSERRNLSNYQLNDILRFNYTDTQCGIEKNHYLTLVAVHEHYLTLQKENGQQVIWQPQAMLKNSAVEVYRAESRQLQIGDLIRWTRSNKKLGLLSPELAKIEQLDAAYCQLRPVKMTAHGIVPDGELLKVDLRDPTYQHWDHAYAMTGYSAQGKTISSLILHAESYRKKLVSRPAFIVGLTRAAQHITIYTDDKTALLAQILKNSGEKTSALEATGKWRPYNSSDNNTERLVPLSSQKDKLIEPAQALLAATYAAEQWVGDTRKAAAIEQDAVMQIATSYKAERMMAAKALESLPAANSISQQHIDRYLHASIQRDKATPNLPLLQKAMPQSVVERVKDELDL